MRELILDRPGQAARSDPAVRPAARPEPAAPAALVCLDDLAGNGPLIAHARLVAGCLGAPVMFGHVLELHADETPPDPIHWALRRERARARLQAISGEAERSLVLEGRPSDQLLRWSRINRPAFLALYSRSGTHAGSGAPRLGHVASALLQAGTASVLLVPPTALARPSYRRLLLPLDGSFASEGAVAAACRIAGDLGAEIVLAHIVPPTEITMIGPLECEAIELRDRLCARNERIASDYLRAVQRRLTLARRKVDLRVARGDPRDCLIGIAHQCGADAIVMSAEGNGRRADQGCGRVATHVAAVSDIPILLVRHSEAAVSAGPDAGVLH